MFLADLFEDDADILQQIISDFGDRDVPPQAAVKKATARSKYRPRPVKGVDHSGEWPQYIRSEKQLRSVANKIFGSPRLTVDDCIKLYTDHYYKIDEMVVLDLPVKQLAKYREYDREIIDDWTGTMTRSEYAELLKDIEQNGIQNYGILSIYENGGANYSAILDEGNHRLSIALTLGVPVMPIKFFYGRRDSTAN